MKRKYHVSLGIPLAMSVQAEDAEEAQEIALARARGGLIMPSWPGLLIGPAEVTRVTEVPAAAPVSGS